MSTKEIIISQYKASLEMLREAVVRCPPDLWDRPEDKNRFWQVAYHALFYTHLYLQPKEQDFVAWDRHQDGSHRMEHQGQPYTKEDILEYLGVCREQVEARVPSLDTHAPSGFDWLTFNKLELQFYNIRHLQQHTGELCERLGSTSDIEVPWVGRA
jgi:DinB superfamily